MKEPYYAVIFTSRRKEGNDEAYAAMSDKMAELAAQQPGYLGHESARGADGFGITVSYWESEDAIRNWKSHLQHQAAQKLGRERFYADYHVRVAKVEREYALGD